MNYDNYFFYRNLGKDKYLGFNLPRYIENYLPENKMAKIIDIGCGLGQTLNCLKKKGYVNILGIDVSKEAIKKCRADGLNVEEKSLTDLDGRYDFIFFNHVLEHVEKKEVIGILGKIYSSLEDEGKLYITVPNAQSNTGCYWAYEDFTHHTLYTAGSLEFVLKSAGFECIVFLDVDGCSEVNNFIKKYVKKFLLSIYRLNNSFWNKVTSSFYHRESKIINTYEIKVIAIKNKNGRVDLCKKQH